ncbi:unnamed protein product [Clonostachys solani]|uniref:beta-N-acetylhexosaminidase n=1 Tax=Clonostachys solani TaxID=160281 RepID=A0A9N9YUX5_9HYPO|nr:unnamed protein product [Clonostachys solani]
MSLSSAMWKGGALLCAAAFTSALQTLPPVNEVSNEGGSSPLSIGSVTKTIYIEKGFASTRDTDGLTLIPPSANEFASLFQQDITDLTGFSWTIEQVDSLPTTANASGIFLGAFTGNDSTLTYENGDPTSEGYRLDVSSTAAFIRGTGARGMWWGTRSLLQLALLGNGTLPTGSRIDAPAYPTRGFMVDAGRKWYAPEFLKEMCSFASFFKMSEFHYHLSDNYPLNRGHNETWQDVYSHFSLRPEDESLLGILHGRENETLSRDDFADLQSHCAARGVTVIPEIEAPGHCLYLTKWKPELSLAKRDLLNLTHPETIPTVKRIWSEFLPWFETKEVHIGADEYDATLADDYITFVNEMASFVNATAGKQIRIWGTNEPSENLTISKEVIVQHWQYGESDPLRLVADGYRMINTEDWWAYMGMKNDHMPILPAKYPQFFNEARIFDFAGEDGWQWQPSLVNPFNASMQLVEGEPLNKGAITAAWNDNGPDASTQLEAYYTMRRGIALVGARAWSGSRGPELEEALVAPSIDFFSPLAPGQNLGRIIPRKEGGSRDGPLVSWTGSGRKNSTEELGYGSKGMNYTLQLSATGSFSLTGPDNKLSLKCNGELVFNADGYEYPLRHVAAQDALVLDPGHPGRIWVNVSTSTHEPVPVSTPANITISTDVLHGSVVWLDGKVAGRFEVFVFGGRNTQFSWSQMAFVAPLETVRGGLKELVLYEETAFEKEERSLITRSSKHARRRSRDT